MLVSGKAQITHLHNTHTQAALNAKPGRHTFLTSIHARLSLHLFFALCFCPPPGRPNAKNTLLCVLATLRRVPQLRPSNSNLLRVFSTRPILARAYLNLGITMGEEKIFRLDVTVYHRRSLHASSRHASGMRTQVAEGYRGAAATWRRTCRCQSAYHAPGSEGTRSTA